VEIDCEFKDGGGDKEGVAKRIRVYRSKKEISLKLNVRWIRRINTYV